MTPWAPLLAVADALLGHGADDAGHGLHAAFARVSLDATGTSTTLGQGTHAIAGLGHDVDDGESVHVTNTTERHACT